FHARADQHVDRRSGVSQRLPITTIETVVSNAEQRALVQGEELAVPRVSDIYAALPSLTGKIELEYEGELKGAEVVARELVRQAVATVFDGYAATLDTHAVVDWFNDGGTIDLSDATAAQSLLELVAQVPGMLDAVERLGDGTGAPDAVRASVADFILEGLCALRRISRSDEGRLLGTTPPRPKPEPRTFEGLDELEDDELAPKGRKKYYN